MRIFVKVRAGSKKNEVIPPEKKLWSEGGRAGEFYVVSVKEPPLQGRANVAVSRLLAEYFEVPNTLVSLVSGASSKIKVFEVGGK